MKDEYYTRLHRPIRLALQYCTKLGSASIFRESRTVPKHISVHDAGVLANASRMRAADISARFKVFA
jgi:hypothetical protein